MLFTGKQHCLHAFFPGGTYLQRISVFRQNVKFGGVTVLAVQLFNRIKRKKNLKKTCFSVFPTCFVKINLSLVKCFFILCFRHLCK